jgi:heme exporter protein A
LLAPTSGELSYLLGDKTLGRASTHLFTGMVSPYLQLYDEFTGEENLKLIASLRCEQLPESAALEALGRVGLEARAADYVRDYSSGMKQRLKFAAACLFKPALLIVDEPRTNLDAEGIEAARRLIGERKKEGAVLIATNDDEDRALCDEVVTLDGAAPGPGQPTQEGPR